MIRLIQNYYIDSNLSRQRELMKCFENNFNNQLIDKMILFSDRVVSEGIKAEYIIFHERPTHQDFYRWINQNVSDDDITIISNSDIWFPEHSVQQIAENIKQNEVYALARWEWHDKIPPHLFDRDDTADSWVFKGKIKDVPDCDFILGRAGTDNAIADRLEKAGYKVLNPSRDIQSFHVHKSGVRRYDYRDTVSKPYLLITPHHLGETPQYRRIPA